MGFAGKSSDQQFDGVYVDSFRGSPGTNYPRGTPEHPVDNLTDALAIARQRSLSRIYVYDNEGLKLEEDLDTIYEFVGRDGYNDKININQKDVNGSIFKYLYVFNSLPVNSLPAPIVTLNISGLFSGNPGISFVYTDFYANQMPINVALESVGTYHLDAIEVTGLAHFVKWIINGQEVFDKEYWVMITGNTTIVGEFINPS